MHTDHMHAEIHMYSSLGTKETSDIVVLVTVFV